MTKFYTAFLAIVFSITQISGQQFLEISTGPNYGSQGFVNLSEGTNWMTLNSAWDISFAASAQGAGIWVNETTTSGSDEIVELYSANTDDFTAVSDTSDFNDLPLFNPEESWENGAFNSVRNPADPFDFGWGAYNPITHIVEGTNVFVLKLRNNVYRKIQVLSLTSGEYTFRHANLDGSDEKEVVIRKDDDAAGTRVYYSFVTSSVVEVEPLNGFDLLFSRYYTLLEDPEGGSDVQYPVTGILSGPGVQVAQADGVDPLDVTFEEWEDSLKTNLDVIGHDWKEFDLSSFQWSLPTDRAYFVVTAENDIWKVVFIDFEGSSSGTATIEYTDLGVLSAVGDPQSSLETFDVYPNPASAAANVVFTARHSAHGKAAKVVVNDLSGRVVLQRDIHVVSGLNTLAIQTADLVSGIYQLNVIIGTEVITEKLVVSQ